MKKSDLNRVLVDELTVIMRQAGIARPIRDEIIKIVDKYTKPKKGGMSINLDKVVKKDATGRITHILDVSGTAFLPANTENFYEAKNGGIEVLKGLSLKRQSRLGEKLRKEARRKVLDEAATPEEGKAKLAKLKVDYSPLLNIDGAIKA
jgi:septum formation topological specificity factor MinE